MKDKYIRYLTVVILLLMPQVSNAQEDETVKYSCHEISEEMIYCYDDSGKPLNGKISVIDDENANIVRSIENFKNGYLDGTSKYYDGSGRIKERINYAMGVKNGRHKIYYENGEVKLLINYKNGLIDGPVEVYSNSRKKLGQLEYKKGKLYKGYCRDNRGHKKNIKRSEIIDHQDNVVYSCGVE